MRHCGLDNNKNDCLCLTCFNHSCIIHYGKLCLLCFHREPKSISWIKNHECLAYYSWTNKLKKKKMESMRNTMDIKYIKVH